MRILIPASACMDSFAENVAHSLRAMGHEVLSAPVHVDAGRLSRISRVWTEFRGKAGKEAPTLAERWALRAAKAFHPHLVLAVTQHLTEETLAELKRLGVDHCVAWWGDSPANLKRWGLLKPGWDAVFLKDRDAVRKFRCVGVNAHHLHEAMNPAWHRPLASVANRSIAVAGNFYAYRQALVSRLLGRGHEVRAYGGRLPFWTLPEIRAIHSGTYIAKEQKSRVFGEALGCLNSMSFAEGNTLNCRAFEVAGAGGLQFMEYRSIIEECFEPGKEILVFQTFEELCQQIAWAEKAPAEAARLRSAGARRAAAEHTYVHRLGALLKVLEAS